MATRAYNELYLKNAASALGVMFDFAVKYRKENLDDFFKKFIDSGVAEQFENGNPAYISGSTGVDLYRAVTGDFTSSMPEYMSMAKTAEYWAGSSIAYYQWYTSRRFLEIVLVVPIKELIGWYPSFRKEDASVFVAEIEKRMRKRKTNLEYFRSLAGMSQSELAALSGVDIRSIQMYEQRRNDISKAQFNILFALSKALGCSVYDLTDKNNDRPLSDTDERYLPDLFKRQLLTDLRRRQTSLPYPDANTARRQAILFEKAYGYPDLFPYEALRFEGGSYTIPREPLIGGWNDYWLNALSKEGAAEEEIESKEKTFTKLVEDALKKSQPIGAQTSGEDGRSVLSAGFLAEAILSAAALIQRSV